MYSILISSATLLVVSIGWTFLGWPGGLWLGGFLGILGFVAVWFIIGRRLKSQLAPVMAQVQQHAQAGNVPLALNALETLLPLGRWVPMLTGQIYAQMGMLAYQQSMGPNSGRAAEKAFDYLQKGSRRSPEGQVLLAVLYHRTKKDLEMALSVLEAAGPFNRRSVYLFTVHAWILNKEGRKDEAVAVLNRLLLKEKDNELAKDNLLRIQNGKKLNMKDFGMQWYMLMYEKPPQSMAQAAQGQQGNPRYQQGHPGKGKKHQKRQKRR